MKYTVSKDGLKWLIAKIKSSLANKADKADGIIYSSADDGSSTDVQSVTEEILQKVYPVGAVYIGTSSANPRTIFGFGTWVQIKDRFLLAAGDSYAAGSTGGEATHTLTISEMPQHDHATPSYAGSDVNTAGWSFRAINSYDASQAVWTKASGGNRPHNNMPPYLAVYMWRRTA